MGIVEILRIVAFVLGAVNIAWLAGMTLAYWRLLQEDPVSGDSGIPVAMMAFCGGFLLVTAGVMWRSVEFYHAPFTGAQVPSVAGLVASALGLALMHRDVSKRQRERHDRSGRHAL